MSTIDKFQSVEFAPGRTVATAKGSGSYLGLNKIDLTGINQIEFAASAGGGMSAGKGGAVEVRLDSPSGKLIGQTDTIAAPVPGAGRSGRGGQRIKAAISDISGVHDIYFVFVNNKAKSTDPLIYLRDIKFNLREKISD